MKEKINNKGFTLVELLAVLIIIIAIMSIAMPTISSSLERSKAKKNNAQNKIYESAARLYISAHKNNIKNEQCCIGLDFLKAEGYVDKNEKTIGCVEYQYITNQEGSNSNSVGRRVYSFQEYRVGKDCLEKEKKQQEFR
ncbi:MAG: prepilin-type N-terminal cleavage/methylation domain-containing protein [Bacilli bacterium]|nr:prepilin-type N-terminal cleavage/methylation domain-containing protein [Bacilli bacterium]